MTVESVFRGSLGSCPFSRQDETSASQPTLLPPMPTTPPPNPSLDLPQGTPVHTRSSTSDKFNHGYESRDDIFSRLADEMEPFFVGPIPARDFLDHFLPPPPSAPSSLPQFTRGMFNHFTEAYSKGQELKLYDPFVSSDPRRTPHCYYV
jgi:hypothetical protein